MKTVSILILSFVFFINSKGQINISQKTEKKISKKVLRNFHKSLSSESDGEYFVIVLYECELNTPMMKEFFTDSLINNIKTVKKGSSLPVFRALIYNEDNYFVALCDEFFKIYKSHNIDSWENNLLTFCLDSNVDLIFSLRGTKLSLYFTKIGSKLYLIEDNDLPIEPIPISRYIESNWSNFYLP